jgi:acyl carrier protein
MTETELRATIFSILSQIAPEADLEGLPEGANLREELDIDSYDFLSFLIGLDEELGVEIPEADYEKLVTLANIIDYLLKRLP